MNRQVERAPLAACNHETVVQLGTQPGERTQDSCPSMATGAPIASSRGKSRTGLRLRPRVVAFLLWIGFAVPLAWHVGGLLRGAPLDLVRLSAYAVAVLVLGWNALRRHDFGSNLPGQYRLLAPLGVGGMGEVFLAEDGLLGRPCAIKRIRPEHAANPHIRARFEREAELMAQLSHGNIVDVFDYGRTSDGSFFYAMEYLPGLSLADLLRRHGPLPASRVVHLLRQVCHGLGAVHASGLIHRDIKPENVFVAQGDGRYDVVKLLDFGLVRPVAAMASPRLTQEGAISGTPLFMSPEQAEGLGNLDARSDIYSLGAVAYALLTGRPPFERRTAMEVLIAHARDEVTPPSQLRGNVPADLERVILRCLAKKPEDRFQDIASLEQALAECTAADQWTEEQAARWWQAYEPKEGDQGNRLVGVRELAAA
jgi:serine/threonine-protein kinase